MSEWKKLFRVKRILALALAVALAVTSAPVTAQAAPENPEQTETTVDNDSAEETEKGNEEDPVSGTTVTVTDEDPAPAEDGDADQPDAENPEGTETEQPDAENPEGTGTEQPDVENPEGTETEQPDVENQEGTETIPEDSADVDGNQSAPVLDADTQDVEVNAAAKAATDYHFIFLDDEYRGGKYEYSIIAPPFSSADGKNWNYGFLEHFYLEDGNGGYYDNLIASYDPVIATIKYQWFEGDKALGEPALLSAEGAFPVDAGTYKLALTLPAKEGEGGYAEAKGEYSFNITQATVSIELGTPEPVAPGTAVADVQLPESISATGSDGKSFTYSLDDKETPDDESKDNEVKYTPVIQDAETGETLAADVKLAADKEYVITVVPEFIGANKAAYDKNYKFAPCAEQKLSFTDLKKTRLSIALDESGYTNAKVTKDAVIASDENGRTVHVIEAGAIADVVKDGKPAFKDEKLETEDGTDDKTGDPKWKDITAAVTDKTLFEGAWYTAADYAVPWTEAGKTFCGLTVGGKMDAAPTTAGAYVYRYSYKGDQKEYAESYADILVIVEVPEIIVKPTVESGTVFYDGQTAMEALAKVGYELPYANDATKKFAVTENMWGTSYVDTGKTQPYKPDFILVEKAKDGTEKSYYGSDKIKYTADSEYFVRFNGYKVIYSAGGDDASRIEIMDGVDSMNPDTCGFKVKTGTDVYKEYQLKVDVKEAGSEIDTSDITKDMTSEKVNVLETFTKVYDDQKIFENFADFKKAKLKSGSADSLKDFGYSWQKSSYSYEALKETEKVDGKDEFVVKEDDIKNSFGSMRGISPVNAGVYRLAVTYTDPKGENFAEPAYVYFVIKPQEITFNLSEELKKGIAGFTGSYDLITNNSDLLAKGTSMAVADAMAGKPSKSEDWKNADALSENADYAYRVTWQVSEKLKTDGKDQVNEDGTIATQRHYGALTTDLDKFVLELTDITLGMADEEGDFRSNANNYNFTVKKDAQILIPITAQTMGTAEINFAGITTIDGSTYNAAKIYDGTSIYSMIQEKLAVLNAPITVGEDGKTKTGDVDAILTYTVEYSPYGDGDSVTETYEKLPTEEAAWAWAKNGGTYYISATFAGNEKYAPLTETSLAVITVNPRELTLTLPALEKTYETGQDMEVALHDAKNAFGELPNAGLSGDILDVDKEYFTETKLPNGGLGYLVWCADWDGGGYYLPNFSVYDKVEDAWYDEGVFQSTAPERYTLRCDLIYTNLWHSKVNSNYAIVRTDPTATPIKVGRGASSVQLNDYEYTKLDITDKVSDGTAPVAKDHQVTVQDAIPYAYDEEPEGNIVAVTITGPAEYGNQIDWSQVSYKKSIENNAKENLVGRVTGSGNSVRFTYNATDKKDLSFSIRWAADYNENFTILFSKADVLGNLRDAVAPKSLAFNAPLTSMVVGQTQDLDVKITKEQMSDVICLGYEVKDGKGTIMHVTEHGTVTALKAGKATVEVFPMHLVNGKKERITEDAKGKPIKPAKVSITVKDVTAPKISKVIAGDSYVKVQYALPKANDGYRREIYVMEGKNLKPDAFEANIEAMKNQQWKGLFAVRPRFMSYDNELGSRQYDWKKNAYIDTAEVYIYGLKPEKTDYTVYVRNVSGMRSFEDDCKVTLSRAGSAKGFATTLPEVSDLVATLKDKNEALPVYELDGNEVKEQPTVDEIRNADGIAYKVPLAQKSVQVSVEGLFADKAGDGEYMPLPLKGDAKKKYADPKMAYYFYEWIYDGYDALTGEPVKEGYGYTTTSKIGTIAKNGKITLKDTGSARIYAVDTVSHVESEWVMVDVTAEADSMTARKANMQVGQRIALKDLVDYKEGSLKLGQNYNDSHALINVKAAKTSLGENASFSITDDGYLVATGVGSAEFDLTDKNIEQSAHIKVTAKALDAVKGLNAINVIDNRFDVRFEMNPYAEAYRINIKDGRGSLIRGIYVENLPFNNNGEVLWDGVDQSDNWERWTDSSDDDDWGSGSWIDDDDWHDRENWVRYNDSNFCRANMINGKMNLTYRIDKLTQSSKYTVEVTTLYKEVEPGKPATKAVTTTKLPAYDSFIDTKLEKNSTRKKNGEKYTDGMFLATANGEWVENYGFVSGNTYSLKAHPGDGDDGGYNRGARYAGTDTLTWSSSNTKVASVQATSGGYSAVLKALKDGETVIEVKSAVLKNVIARYTITVSTVGDAYKGRDYYGDNEDLRDEESAKKDLVTKMVVGVPVAVDVKYGETFHYEFAVTEEGEYTTYKVVKGKSIEVATNSVDAGEKFPHTVSGLSIEGYEIENADSLVIKRTGTTDWSYGNEFKNRKAVKVGEQFDTEQNAWYVFTAPADGFYKAKYNDWYNNSSSYVYTFAGYEPKKEGDAVIGGEEPTERITTVLNEFYYLKKDQLLYLHVENYTYGNRMTGKVEKAEFDPLKAGDDSIALSSYSSKWYEFTAAEAGDYEFAISDNNGSVSMYDASADANFRLITYDPKSGWDEEFEYYTYSYSLTANQKVYVRFYAYSGGATFKVSKKAAEPATPETP